MKRTFAALAIALLCLAPLLAKASDWVQAPGSRLAFAGQYQGEIFTGTFPGFSTRLHFDPANPASARLEVTIPMANATTGNSDYDGEMRGASFFNSAAFGQARFQAEGARRLDNGHYEMDGRLTLRGISKPVRFTFEWVDGPQPMLVGRARVQRLDFDVGLGEWADTRMIPNIISVATRVHFNRAAP